MARFAQFGRQGRELLLTWCNIVAPDDTCTKDAALLVIEDDSSIRAMLCALLAAEGYKLSTAVNGAEGLARMRAGSVPDLILLDLMMPVMDGWQFRLEQKRDPVLGCIPVIAISANDSPQAAAIDADVYLRKPIDFALLVRTIDRVLIASERRKLEAQCAELERLRALGTMAAGVAHEIRNPLSFVTGNLAFALGELGALVQDATEQSFAAVPPPRTLDRLAQIRAALAEANTGALRISSIVRDMSTFARSEEESVVAVDVHGPLEAAISLAFPELRQRARLVRDYASTPPANGNEARLAQVFVNLLLNAAQAIEAGNAQVNEIRVVTGSTDQSNIFVEIRDTGCGIEPSIVPRIFDPFFTTKPVGRGMGLGLAICRGIMAGLGGQISVQSERGKGSVFRVELQRASSPRSSQAPAPKAELTPSERPGGRVLVVDDEEFVGALLKRVLSPPYNVCVLRRGQDALETIQKGSQFDAILCDLMMPEMTGMDLYRKLSEVSPRQAGRMIFITGGTFTTEAETFRSTVGNPFVDKPFDLDLVRRLIEERVAHACKSDAANRA